VVGPPNGTRGEEKTVRPLPSEPQPQADTPRERLARPGKRIRQARKARKLTLQELGDRVGLTGSHISQIERGTSIPSVGALWEIADELGLSMADLFAAGNPTLETGRAVPTGLASTARDGAVGADLRPETEPSPVVDPRAREVIKMAGVEWQRLTPDFDETIEFMQVRHEVGAGDDHAYHHRGREYGLVIQGRLLAELGFSKFMLEPGFSISFDSSTPHRFLNAGDEPVIAVWVIVGRH
jgi:transcriptional regulator with XRE-family HTH domain